MFAWGARGVGQVPTKTIYYIALQLRVCNDVRIFITQLNKHRSRNLQKVNGRNSMTGSNVFKYLHEHEEMRIGLL